MKGARLLLGALVVAVASCGLCGAFLSRVDVIDAALRGDYGVLVAVGWLSICRLFLVLVAPGWVLWLVLRRLTARVPVVRRGVE